MSGRHSLMGLLAVMLLLALAGPASAGGFAVVRLDEEPGVVAVDVPWRFGFMVLQHDVTPNGDVTPVVRALHKETGEVITATGSHEGAVGHFVAELTLPLAGEWKWSIEPQPYIETSFPTLTVHDGSVIHSWPTSLVTLYLTDLANVSEPLVTAAEAETASQTVEIIDPWAFAPYSVQIEAGTAVTWVNHSAATHMVTGDDLAFDNTGPIGPGESVTTTFDEPGTYGYRCSPHPGMVGEIVVS